MDTQLNNGARDFVEGLLDCGCAYQVRDKIIVFQVTPVLGVHTGLVIETGVEINELAGWPMSPLHWVHLPSEISVGPTNSQASPIPGWLKHSRNAPSWGNAQVPVQAWLAHVQSVLGMARAA